MSNGWKDKSELEQVIFSNVHGTPELRKRERQHYLGHFRERILEAVTWNQLKTDKGKSHIKKALTDPRAYELVIHSRARSQAMPLIREAQSNDVDFTVVNNSQLKGPIVVAVAAKQAVDVKRLHADEQD